MPSGCLFLAKSRVGAYLEDLGPRTSYSRFLRGDYYGKCLEAQLHVAKVGLSLSFCSYAATILVVIITYAEGKAKASGRSAKELAQWPR